MEFTTVRVLRGESHSFLPHVGTGQPFSTSSHSTSQYSSASSGYFGATFSTLSDYSSQPAHSSGYSSGYATDSSFISSGYSSASARSTSSSQSCRYSRPAFTHGAVPEHEVGYLLKMNQDQFRVCLKSSMSEDNALLLHALYQLKFISLRLSMEPGEQGDVGYMHKDSTNQFSVFLNTMDIRKGLQFVSPLYQLKSPTVRLQRTEQSLADEDWPVTNIFLPGEGLQPHDAHALADVLSLTTELQTLDLGYNNIGSEGCTHLAPALKMCTNLQALYLYGNNIGDEGLKCLVPSLKSCANLAHLHLYRNALTDGCVQDITELIMSLNSLTQLGLWGNRFSEHGKASIRREMERKNKSANYSKLRLPLF